MRSSPPDEAVAAPSWRLNFWLFAATVGSVLFTGIKSFGDGGLSRGSLVQGALFAGSLLTILVAHEAGHFIAARIHKVDASLPYFLPMPLSPFGTMGAVIRMRGTIPTRRALLDIGASGPLAGLVFAIPLYLWGVAHSRLVPLEGEDMVGLGNSVLLHLLDRIAAPTVPDGMDILLSPVAFGAWAGMFVTMINLIPAGQLDGGHVAYALFGSRQDKFAVVVHRAMLAFFFVSLGSFVFRDLRAGFGLHRIGTHVGNSMFWFMWFQVLAVLGTLASRGAPGAAGNSEGTLTIRTRVVATVGLLVLASIGRERSSPILWIAWFVGLGFLLAMETKWGVLKPHALLDHPPTGAAPLDRARAVIAIVTLAFFALLFMPTPFSM